MPTLHDMDRPIIEQARQFGGQHAVWNKYDIMTRLNELMGRLYYLDATLGQFTSKLAVGWQTPWIHIKQACTKRCNLDTGVKFEKFGFIAPRCLQCWKVVVMPRTLKELFQLLALERSLNRPSKCGIELRNYTPRHYGGYFYNNSLEEGRECYTEVREAVSDAISPDVTVILKRGCTEFEMSKGNAALWSITPEELEMDTIIEDRFVNNTPLASKQPDMVEAYVHKEWMKWAFSNGDKTYLEYNGGVPMFPEYQNFHEHDIEDLKHDMALAQGMANGINPEHTDEYRVITGNFLREKGLTGEAAGHMLGIMNKNYFEPVVLGEHDETT